MSRLGRTVFAGLLAGCALLFVNYAFANNALRVDEARARLRFVNERAEVTLPVINPFGRGAPANIRLELLNNNGDTVAADERAGLRQRDYQLRLGASRA